MIKSAWIVLLATIALPVGSWDRSAGEPCREVESCLKALRLVAKPSNGRGHSSRDLDAAVRLLTTTGGTDTLVELLADPDPTLANFAAYGLRNAPAIDVRHLPAVLQGLDRGLGWLPGALARIDSVDAAREAVDRYLVSESAPHNQELYAVTESGARAIPFMVERAACQAECTERTHALLAYALEDMSPERGAAARPLMHLVRNHREQPEVAHGALMMISALALDGQVIESELLEEYSRTTLPRAQVENALIGIHSKASGDILAARITTMGNGLILREIAQVGVSGRSAGPRVTALLDGPATRERIWAATTLGFINYREAIPSLIRALDDQLDPLFVWAAANALGRLNAKEASTKLSRIAGTHWYPPVRDAASAAARAIATGEGLPAPRSQREFMAQYTALMGVGGELPECRRVLESKRTGSRARTLYRQTSEDALKHLAYPTFVISYGAADEQEQRDAGQDIITVDARNIREHREQINQIPDVALRVDDGWLVGGDRGEWGGELVFVGDDGTFQTLLEENVHDLHLLGDKVVATAGLAHMGLNSGSLQEIHRSPEGIWTASTWRILPGAPEALRPVEPDGLMIETVRKGSVVVNANGEMRMARCADS